MPISQKVYVDITSGVGGGTSVRQRDLITRIFTENPLIPTGGYVEFTSAADVADYFGSDSDEYDRAAFYFGWVSKNITSPKKISYANWAASATAPLVFGDPAITQALGSWTSISSGSFYLTLGLDTELGPNKILISGLNFTGAGSLSAVAAIIQAAVRDASDSALWTAATVVWNSTRGSFDLTGGVTGVNAVAVDAGPSGDIAGQLGWIGVGAILSDGAAPQSLTDLLDSSSELSNNFASFLFIPVLNLTQVTEVVTWNDIQNVMYMYLLPVSAANASAWYTALKTYSGTAMTLTPTSGQYDEMVPGMVLAATDYNAQNSTQNYMFQLNFDGLDAKVTTTTQALAYDILRTNYYGNTQTAGQVLTFYQRGTMMGGTTDPVDQNVYSNEIWLKDAAAAEILTLLLALAKVSANTQGEGQVITVLQNVINQALRNGVISVGKPLNTTQKLFIAQETGSDKAWYQVQNTGYWLGAEILAYTTEDSRTEYEIKYTLIYSKDDTVRKVIGRHILI